jgi:hemerythrin superfamily protein
MEVMGMARSTTQQKGARKSTRARSTRRAARNGNGSEDAIALLKADHRAVEELFDQFEKTRSDDRKEEIAHKICAALKAHTIIEEEIFYPAFLEATRDKDIHHEAEVEHDGAKRMIADIEGMSSDDDYYDAKVTVLSEMIKHHVNEEEKRGGMFAEARDSGMDLDELGERLRRRKAEVMPEVEGNGGSGSEGRRGRRLPAGMLSGRERLGSAGTRRS